MIPILIFSHEKPALFALSEISRIIS